MVNKIYKIYKFPALETNFQGIGLGLGLGLLLAVSVLVS